MQNHIYQLLIGLIHFLGVQGCHDINGLHLRQGKYITDLLHKTDLVGAKPFSQSTISSRKLTSQDGKLLTGLSKYRMIVGALQYCTISRPDISYVVIQLCQFMHSPCEGHWTALKLVLQYLKVTVDYGLYYTPLAIELNAYCDSDWAGNPDDEHSIYVISRTT